MTSTQKSRSSFQTKIVRVEIEWPSSRLGAPNPIPKYRWQQPTPFKSSPPERGLSEDESRHSFEFGAASLLPYRLQDDYDHNPVSELHPVVSIDNGLLGITVAPRLGGRLLTMHDHATGRDLVFANPVFQPGNLGLLNAWFSGGIEWNGLIPGHTPFACSQVFAAKLETDRGPILRLYEFDRVLEATWQIDLFLPNDDNRLFVHGRIVNADRNEKLAYWWTNVAVGADKGTRVVSPADYAIEHVLPGNQLERFPFPDPDRADNSFPNNSEHATSVFFRSSNTDRAWANRTWIAALDETGNGLAQTATRQMKGRKFFYFGTAAGGKHWMDHLARPGEGEYIEIQSGMTPTQNQKFELAGHSEFHWSECYGAVSVDPEFSHAANYQDAVDATGVAISKRFPEEEMKEIDVFLHEISVLPAGERIAAGSPWGQRDEKLTGRPLAKGLDFSVNDDVPDAWDELASDGRFSERSLSLLPMEFVVSERWCKALSESAEKYGDTWLHDLVLGIAALDREDRSVAALHFDRSLARKETWLGFRQRALVSDTPQSTERSYLKAWSFADAPPELAEEIIEWFQNTNNNKSLAKFIANLPKRFLDRERVVLFRALVAARNGSVQELEQCLSRDFATIREGETILEDLWRALQRNRLLRRLGREPAKQEIEVELENCPLPGRLDFRLCQ